MCFLLIFTGKKKNKKLPGCKNQTVCKSHTHIIRKGAMFRGKTLKWTATFPGEAFSLTLDLPSVLSTERADGNKICDSHSDTFEAEEARSVP